MKLSTVYHGIEDARIFSHQTGLFMTGTIHFEDITGVIHPKICYGKINLQAGVVEKLAVLEPSDIDIFVPQKNWMALSRDKHIYFVTFIKPFCMYLLQDDLSLVKMKLPIRYQGMFLENLRGGTPFVQHGESYLSISHRKIHSPFGVTYDMRALKLIWHEDHISISASQPFRLPFSPNENIDEDIQFPMGLIVTGKVGYVSYGIDDSLPGISSFEIDMLDFNWTGYSGDVYVDKSPVLLVTDDVFLPPIISAFIYLRQKYTHVAIFNPFIENIANLPVVKRNKEISSYQVTVLLVSQYVHSAWMNAIVILDWDLPSLPVSWYPILSNQRQIHVVSKRQAANLIDMGIPRQKIQMIEDVYKQGDYLSNNDGKEQCDRKVTVNFQAASYYEGGLDTLLEAIKRSPKILKNVCFVLDILNVPSLLRESISDLKIRGGSFIASNNFKGASHVYIFSSRMPMPRINSLLIQGPDLILIIPETWKSEFQSFTGKIFLLEVDRRIENEIEKHVIIEGKRDVFLYTVHPIRVQSIVFSLEQLI